MNKDLMNLNIITPTSSTTMKIKWLEAQTKSGGSFIVQPGRAPIIVTLAPNKDLTIELNDGTKQIITIIEGILEVNRNYATVLLINE